MAKPLLLIAASIPVILAVMIAIPMITNPQIPFSATNADDRISVEFTKHRLLKSSLGLTERLVPQKSEILTISNEGNARYLVTEGGVPQPEKTATLDRDQVKKLIALVKETGFMKIPLQSIAPDDDILEYDRFSLKVTLNGETKQIQWPEQKATSEFIPPIITMVGSELQNIAKKLNQ
ncbi:MAG: hypothetical protein WAO91_02480 [Candidatus Nitrosotenuis sp.]